MGNLISITGNLGQDATLKFVNNGSAVLELNVADTPRKKTDAGWIDDGNTVWFRCSLWGPMAEAIANSGAAVKGAMADVTGVLTVREFEHNGEKRTSHDVRINTIGIREKRGAGQGQAAPAQTNPWGAPTTQGQGFTETPPF